jgi:gamma-glutamyltranspeptidase / glutathione hydrolase
MLKIIFSSVILFIAKVSFAQIVGAGKMVDPFQISITKNSTVNSAGVVSANHLASKIGVAILKKGGNAYDAAIATQLALAVVYPGAGNIGGGGFLVGFNAKTQKHLCFDYREMAPALSFKDMYLDSAGNALTELSQNGHLASGVPGTIAGLWTTHQYAKLPWKTLVQPAIDLAMFGFVISENEANSLNNHYNLFVAHNTKANAFNSKSNWKKGDTLIQTDLANTLIRIRDNGKTGFYEGQTAQLIVEEMNRGYGIITLNDLKNYEVKVRKPITFKYKKDFTIITMPPPSSGGVMLQMMMNMVENKNVKQLGFQSANYMQLITEVERLAYADRAQFLGDMDFYKVPLKTLTSKAYANQRMATYKPNIANQSKLVSAGTIQPESEETTHISIVDSEGNMVAITTTLNGSYGSHTVVGGAGFLLNNEMDDFSIKPGVANMYGALGGEANKIEPKKRMLSSMTPTIVLKNNKPYFVCGTPGGTTIITSVFQSVLNIIEYNQTAKEAVNNPKFHHQWFPDEVFYEKNIPETVLLKLKEMGYTVTKRGAIGRTEIIKFLPNKKIELAADYRGDDSAAGY